MDMEGELGQMLSAVLSDPDQMAKLTRMAQSLMGGEETAPAEDAAARPEPAAGDQGVLSALGRAFGPRAEQSRSTALLQAMRPYMRPEKQEKLDRAMKIARMARIAGAVMEEVSGRGL